VINVLSEYHIMYLYVQMDKWVSSEQPLMGLCFNYLQTVDVCRFRLTTKNTELTDVYSQHKWDDYVIRTAPVYNCAVCLQQRGWKCNFFCTCCGRYVCPNCVLTCKECLNDLCFYCAKQGRCC